MSGVQTSTSINAVPGKHKHCCARAGWLEHYWPCTGGLSAVSVIGAHLRDPMMVDGIDGTPSTNGRGMRGAELSTRFSPMGGLT